MAVDDNQPSGDPSAGSVSPSRIKTIKQELIADIEKLWYRIGLFIVFAVLAFAMLGLLTAEIFKLLTRKSLENLSQAPGWHFGVFIIGMLIILASVPLTIFLSLLKMASGTDKGEEEGFTLPFTTPQLELLKAALELVKAPSKE
jgi:hypothetical protein